MGAPESWTRKFSPMELEYEEEQDSLIRETADMSVTRASILVRHRKGGSPLGGGGPTKRERSFLKGFLRQSLGNSFWIRNFIGLSILAVVVLVFMDRIFIMEQQSALHPAVQQQSPHNSTFAGGPVHDKMTDSDIPKSNVGHAVPSISVDNIVNKQGHYLHNPFLSPFASTKYNAGQDESTQFDRQRRFEERRQIVAKRFGEWKDPPMDGLISPHDQYFAVPYRDVLSFAWPPNSWQLDREFQLRLIDERLKLIQRVKEGIYYEYGWGGDNLTDEQKQDRERRFGVLVHDFDVVDGEAVDIKTKERLPGIAYLGANGWNGLVRKCLHAMMTQDDFYVVAVGSDALYKGHNLFQTHIMQFNYIMEPVLDLMGIKLIARNMGMDASTTVSALGGGDIYGEADILWVVSDNRADVNIESDGQFDLLQKQAILSGERMPVILTPNPVELNENTQRKAWLGNIQPGNDVCGETKKGNLPPVRACQYLQCSGKAQQNGECDQFRSICWVNRYDINPNDVPDQSSNLGIQPGYPNFRQHQWEGRKLSLLMLHALEEALNVWGQEISENGVPLDDSLWHVNSIYNELRDSIRTLERPEGEGPSACEKLLKDIDPEICHMSMHAFTEWTPRVRPDESSFRAIVETDFVNPNKNFVELYGGVDLLPHEWELSDEDIDVHLIAIATPNKTEQAFEAEELFRGYDKLDSDDDWVDFDSDDYVSGDDYYGRRQLADMNFENDTVPSHLRRRLIDPSASKWKLSRAPIGFCDGSAQSHCNRKAVGNTCLLANKNHYQAGFLGTGDGEEIRFTVSLKEGIVLIRLQWDERTTSLTAIPSDLKFEYTLNGKKTVFGRDKFMTLGKRLADDLIVYPLLVDREMSHEATAKNLDMEVRLRFFSADEFRVLLTHVYYA